MFSIGFLTLDIIILAAIFAGFFFWSLKSEKKVLARFILIFYPTTLIFFNLPAQIDIDSALIQIIIYLVIFVALFILLKRNATSRKLHSGMRKTVDGVILSFSSLITLLIIYYHVLPIEDLYSITLPFTLSKLISSTIPLGILLVIPIIGILLTNKSDRN